MKKRFFKILKNKKRGKDEKKQYSNMGYNSEQS